MTLRNIPSIVSSPRSMMIPWSKTSFPFRNQRRAIRGTRLSEGNENPFRFLPLFTPSCIQLLAPGLLDQYCMTNDLCTFSTLICSDQCPLTISKACCLSMLSLCVSVRSCQKSKHPPNPWFFSTSLVLPSISLRKLPSGRFNTDGENRNLKSIR